MFTRGHCELPAASFSPGIWHEHGLSFSRSQQMRSMLRAARVLPGNSAAAERSPASPATNAATGPKLPVKTFRLGRVKAAVWENGADQKKFFNVTFART